MANICLHLLNVGFLTRGGITVGMLHHKDNIVFGPALIDAVQLEKEALYPRLVCSPDVIDHFEKFNLDPTGRRSCEQVVIDQLGRKIANLLWVGLSPEIEQQLNVFEMFECPHIEKRIGDELQKHIRNKSDKHAEKWQYMKDVLKIMMKHSESGMRK